MAFNIGGSNIGSNIGFSQGSNLGRDALVSINDNFSILLGELFGGFTANPTPTSPVPPATSQPTPTTALAPVDIRPLVAAIPIANDGQVITAEYHNTLRAAILAIAERLGVGALAPTNTFTFAPSLLRSGNSPEWFLDAGVARQPVPNGGNLNAVGWFPVQLPQGSRIDSMTVRGNRTGTMEGFTVSLNRQRISGSQTATELVSLELNEAANPFEEMGQVDVSAAAAETGAGGSAAALTAAALLADFVLVDNDTYKYLVRATLTEALTNSTAQIHSVQIVCREV